MFLRAAVWLACFVVHGAAGGLELRDGDRALFIGDTFFEREGDYGWLETRLVERLPGRQVVFRNLAWAADSPMGRARASFDWSKSPEDWLARVKEQVALVKPTVAFLSYGITAALEGDEGLAHYQTDLGRLMDAIESASGGPVRFVLLGPTAAGPGFLSATERQTRLMALARAEKATEAAATARNAQFVSLLAPTPLLAATWDGVHWTEDGWRQASLQIIDRLALAAPKPANRAEPALGLLRAAIRHKNQLFFYRWRPSNWTYLFGFRKNEQGRNAVEIPRFEPLISEWDQRVQALSRAGGPDSAAAAETQRLLAAVAAAPAAPKAVAAQPIPSFEVADGFEATLWAENPQLHKPIEMNWDARGRLWVASSEVYPQIQPGQPASDTIVVLEDSTGGGKANRASVFAGGLLIPTGVLPDDQGGCYVAASHQLLHFEDTTGAGKSDRRRIVASSFGTEDTHHNLHTLRWGYDGRMYLNQSIYTHTHLETPHGVARLNSGGIWRYDPLTESFEILAKGGCNPWGHHWDAWGDEFFTDGAGSKGVYHLMPGGTYFTYADMRREADSISPGNYPKFASLELVRSPNFPADWQGNLITCDFRAHRVVRFALEEVGSTFQTREMPDLLRSTNVTFRPIDVRFGPDGALYVADWSNPIIQHGEVDFRDPRRDKEHGRIWRVAAKGRPAHSPGDLTRLDAGDLLNRTLSSNAWEQASARRLSQLRLTGRTAADIRRRIGRWAAGQTDPRANLEAAWLEEALGARDGALLESLARSVDFRLRAAAARALGHAAGDPAVPAAGAALARLAGDSHPRVRLEALRGLAQVATPAAAGAALAVLEKPMDPTLDYAAWLTINDLEAPWIASVRSGEWQAGRDRQLEFALKSIRPETAGEVLQQWLADHPIERDGNGGAIELIGQAGGPRHLRKLFDLATAGGLDHQATVRAFRALAEAARLRHVRPEGDLTALAANLTSSRSADVTLESLKLAAQWPGAGPWIARAVAIAGDPAADPAVFPAAFETVRALGGKGAVAALSELADRGPADRRWRAAATLAALDLGTALPRIAAQVKSLEDEAVALQFWRTLLAVKGAARAVADSLPTTGLSPAAARAGMRAAREGGRSDLDLARKLAQGGGLADARSANAQLVSELTDKAAKAGDPVRGEWVFRRADLACATCHAVGGAGGKVGPDLTSIGASAPLDYLVESLLLPSARIKEGYQTVAVTLKDGSDVAGTLARETAAELVLRTAAGGEQSIPKADIDKRGQSEISLMPAGLLDALGEQDQLDLFAFLSRLGKPGPFDASHGGVARRWRLTQTVHTDAQAGQEFWPVNLAFTDKRWSPAYSLVNGNLPARAIRAATGADVWTGRLAVYAATELDAAAEVAASMNLTAGPGAELLVDGQKIGGVGPHAVRLSAGRHRILVRLDPQRIPENVRLQADGAAFVLE